MPIGCSSSSTPRAAAKALLDDLPSLIPEDPALAAVIAEAMAAEFVSVLSQPSHKSQPSQNASLANKDGVCTSPNGPAGCKSPTCPGKQASSKMPNNDGKLDFNGNRRAKSQADSQSREFGYEGIDDMMAKSTSVTKEKVDSIVEGGDFTCEPHEAVAALRTLSVIKSNVGGEVKLSERVLRHYVCGERRHHRGEPEISRLISLPKAIDAVKHSDSRHWELNDKPVVVMPGEKPEKGTQAVYCKNRGKTKTYAYADSGVLNGWQVN